MEAIEDVKASQELTLTVGISPSFVGSDDAWSITNAPRFMGGCRNHGSDPVGLPMPWLVANASNVPFYLWVGDEDKERKSSFDTFRTSLTAVGNPPKSWWRQVSDTTIARRMLLR